MAGEFTDKTILVSNEEVSVVGRPSEPENGAVATNFSVALPEVTDPPPSDSIKFLYWKLEGLTVIVLSVIIFAAAVTFALIIHILVGPPQVIPHGGVAADSAECARIGSDIIKGGGSAVDGAIASTLCLTVMRPDITGVAGCGLMLVHDRSNLTTYLLDFHCAAPYPSSQDTSSYNGSTIAPPLPGSPSYSARGRGSVALPGLIKGLYTAHRRFGKVKWSTLFQGAIRIAKQGFNVSVELSNHTSALASSITLPELLKVYSVPAGTWVKPLPVVAETLTRLSGRNGVRHIYGGDFGQDMATTVAGIGMTSAHWLENLVNYTVISSQRVRARLGDYAVDTFPAPSMGAAILTTILNALQFGPALSNSDGTIYHRVIELYKLAVSALGSGGFPTSNGTNDTSSSTNMSRSLWAQMNYSAAYLLSSPFPLSQEEEQGGSAVTATDSTALFVSMTTTLGSPFGSGVVTNNSGILLNNAMSMFSSTIRYNPAIPQQQRPPTAMCPLYVHNLKRKCGTRFTAAANRGYNGVLGLLQVVLNAIALTRPACPDDCLDLLSAVNHGRLSVLFPPANMSASEVILEEQLAGQLGYLTGLGDRVWVGQTMQGVQASGMVRYSQETVADRRLGAAAATF